MNLIAAQMDYGEAMREVLGDRFEGEADPEISDDEFLASCPIRKRVNTAKFDSDALLYRKLQKERIAFSRDIGWGKMRVIVANRGIYFRRLTLFLEAKHPREWVTCGRCVKGINTEHQECSHCKGGGYQIG